MAKMLVTRPGPGGPAGGAAPARHPGRRRDAAGPADTAGQPAGEADRRPGRAAQHPDQPAVADLLPVDGCGTGERGDRGLPLRGARMTDETMMPPVHPGEILAEEYLKPLGVS